MRITAFQKQLIYENTIKSFGQNAHVWLFGSRVNDLVKGGDIDLYIEPSIQNAAILMEAKFQLVPLLAALYPVGSNKLKILSLN